VGAAAGEFADVIPRQPIRSGSVFLDETASVHPSVRIIGPVVVQRGATLEADVTLVGPTVIGIESHIGAGSTIAQSLVGPYARVMPNTDVIHRVVSGQWSSTTAAPSPAVSGGRWAGGDAIRNPARTSASRKAPTPPRARALGLAAKRAMDVALSALGLVALSLPLAVVAVLIKIDSKGPVFFSHRREGRNGKEFSCLKFRTMVSDADRMQRSLYVKSEVDGPQFKIAVDPRVTRMGRWVRGRNVDELPQLVNVLLGQMSLVGPRPSPFRENQICVPWRRARLSVRPGITGLWQLCRSDHGGGDFHQWIYFDMLYVRNQSFWLDVKILLATLWTGGRRSVPYSKLLGRRATTGVALRSDSPTEPLFYAEFA
jgi:lipopolysaccharide/colanic/teichoic acid biosynthesis glycosyltransferase